MTDKKIFDLLERGERLEAYELLVETYHSALIRKAEYWISRYKIPVTPDEVVEDVLVRFIMDELHRGARDFLTFLKSMVRSDLHQAGRYYWRLAEMPPDIKGYSALEDEIISRDEAERLEREIILSSIVSNNHLVALMMRYKHDVEPAYIAAVLKLKPESVPVILSTTKKRIRTYVTDPAYRPRTPKETDPWMYSLSSAYLSLSVLFAEILKTAKAGSLD